MQPFDEGFSDNGCTHSCEVFGGLQKCDFFSIKYDVFIVR